jgi:drug/metabolite transporter (DMT)-like permease
MIPFVQRQLARPAAPIAVGVLAIGLFSLMDALMKVVALEIGALSAVFWRHVISIAFAGLLFFVWRTPWPSWQAARQHVKRGLVLSITSVSFFYGLTAMPLADAIALSFISPLLMVFLASWLLGEAIRPTALVGCALGLVGVLVIVGGQMRSIASTDALLGAGAILVSAATYALAQVMLRRQASAHVPALSIAFLQPLVVGLVLAAPTAAMSTSLPPDHLWPWLLASALLTTLCQLLLVWSYARAETQVMAPLEYSAFIWAILFGWALFREPLTLATLAGAVLIVAACLLATRR